MSCTNIPANEVSCTPSCEDTIKILREHNDLLKREVKDLKYEGYQLKKGQKPLKAELEEKTKDFRKLQEVYSNKCENYDYIKRQLATITEELDTLKIKCGKTNVSFKNYTASSQTIKCLFETQLKFNDNQNKGLGYDSVPPPFNHNYM